MTGVWFLMHAAPVFHRGGAGRCNLTARPNRVQPLDAAPCMPDELCWYAGHDGISSVLPMVPEPLPQRNNHSGDAPMTIQTLAAVAGIAAGVGTFALALYLLRGSAFCRP